MLRQLRSRKTMKRVLQVTLILIIPSFVAFYGWSAGGGGRGQDGGDTWWAKYKGGRWFGLGWEKIHPDRAEIDEAKNSLSRRASDILRLEGQQEESARLRKLLREYTDSSQRVATEAVNLRLLDKAAKAEEISVHEFEVIQMLKSYINRIRSEDPRCAKMSEQEIARFYGLAGATERQARALSRQHVQSLRSFEALPSLPYIWSRYRASYEKLTAEWAPFAVADFEKSVSPTTDTLKKYFDEHGPDYAFPDQREYKFVVIRKRDVTKSITITTSALRQNYDENKAQFMEPPSVKARVIQLTAPGDNVSTQAMKQYTTKISEVEKLLKSPKADFAVLANKYSDDPPNVDPNVAGAKRGGLMDELITSKRKSLYGEEFDAVALKMKDGETTGPINTYKVVPPMKASSVTYFIKAEKAMPARQQTFEECMPNIEQQLLAKETEKRFIEARERFKQEHERQTTLEGLAGVMGATVGGPTLVRKEAEFIPEVGLLSGEKETLLEMKKNEQSPVLSTPNFHVVLQLQKDIPAHPAEFDQVVPAIRKDVVAQQAAEKAKEAAQKFMKAIEKPGADFAKEAKTAANDAYTTGAFTRNRPSFGTVKNFDLLSEDVTTGSVRMDTTISEFEAKPGANPKPISYVVWKVTGVESPAREDFLKIAPNFLHQWASSEGMMLYNEWLADMRRDVQFQLSEYVR